MSFTDIAYSIAVVMFMRETIHKELSTFSPKCPAEQQQIAE